MVLSAELGGVGLAEDSLATLPVPASERISSMTDLGASDAESGRISSVVDDDTLEPAQMGIVESLGKQWTMAIDWFSPKGAGPELRIAM